MSKIKAMSIMAHQDDFEFTAGGLFAMLRKRYGTDLELKIIATSRGASGHHEMGPEETFRRREKEAQKSASIIGASYECMKCLDGFHIRGQVMPDINVLGGVWNAIRGFEPDYIFCPPVISNPLAGIHVDHYNTAWAVRMVAYQLIVPNAYPTINSNTRKRMGLPLIINVDDPYADESSFHVAVDISDTYDRKVEMSSCHVSQVFEWLPWTNNEKAPTAESFAKSFLDRHRNVNKKYGMDDNIPREFFTFTKWGRLADEKDLEILFGSEVITGNAGKFIGTRQELSVCKIWKES